MAEQLVGAEIRHTRVARGISLRRFAADLGVSPATLSALERGRAPITVARLQRIADLLAVPTAGLLSGAAASSPPVASGRERNDRDWRRFDDLDLGPVLSAAVHLFVRQGYHATSMRELATVAGVSVAGIYHHYPSKQHILVALMDVTMAEIRWRLIDARSEGQTPVESLALMVESLALCHAVRGELAFIGASEMRGITGDDLARITELRNEVQHLLDAQAASAFPGADLRTACRAIATMCTSLPSWFRVDGALSPAQVARQYSGLAIRMVETHVCVPDAAACRLATEPVALAVDQPNE